MDNGFPVPSFGINCELDRRTEHRDETGVLHCENGKHAEGGHCCVLGLLHVAKVAWAKTGGTGKCSVCGANFVYGDVWRHDPTGEHIHIGHDCAAKYELLADRSAFELEAGRHRAAAAAQIIRTKNIEERTEFLASNPGLAEALEVQHEIITDIAHKLQTYRSLSPKQIALVHKLADEIRNPKPPKPEEAKISAPLGKQTFRGKILSTKLVEGAYGNTLKMTVKVETPAGYWIAWGTAPAALLDETINHAGALRGIKEFGQTEVEIKATLEPGTEAHFAFMKRPRGKVTKLACGGLDNCGWCREQVAAGIASLINFAVGV